MTAVSGGVGPASDVDPATGLTESEAQARLAAQGYNEVPESSEHPIRRFLSKFWGPSGWMLELIVILSLALGKYADAIVVSVLLVVNAIVSIEQERRAAGVVATLRRRLQINARLLRDRTWRVAPARELVVGDIVRVRAGDIVPAEVRLLAGSLTVDQSALTGESTDVAKSTADTLTSGSVVRRGEGTGIVVATGARTYFGRTTQLVESARPALHIEQVVGSIVRKLFAIVGTLVVIVVVLLLVRGAPVLDALPLLLVLLMSAVPVALPVMFTVSMAVGAAELARRGVLVTRLSAAEDAATMNVLCVDKTGTLTMNALVVAAVSPEAGYTENDVVLAAALASQEADQDPIDLAILAAARQRALVNESSLGTTLAFQPFDPGTRRTEALLMHDGKRIRVMKGAVKAIAVACGASASALAALEARADEAAGKGYRTIAVSRGPEPGPGRLIGLISLYDPPRPDARALIGAVRALGIRVVLLTGDALPIARQIGTELGLPSIRLAADLNSPAATLATADGFAEVYPEDKYALVRRLQASGHAVGMTGDGVNDAPALRQAEVGIAVRGATDVARGAASVVLTQPGLANIVALVEQGRTIYQRVLTWVINKISRTLLKAGYVAVAYVLTGRFVISALGMLLLVFMTDFAKITLATDHVRWSRRPETWAIGPDVRIAVVLGLCMTAEALGLLGLAYARLGLTRNGAALSTFSFLTLLYFAAFSILSVRERRWFWSSRPSLPLLAGVGAELLVGTILTRVGLPGLPSLPWWQTFVVLGYAMVACLSVNDALKTLLLRRRYGVGAMSANT